MIQNQTQSLILALSLIPVTSVTDHWDSKFMDTIFQYFSSNIVAKP